MVNLGKCLLYLLDRHGQVSVVGLGTFSQMDKAGYFDAQAQSFFPASRHYSFSPESPSDLHQDLIVDYICVQRRIDKVAAQAAFRRTLNQLFSELERKGTFQLDGLGILKQENDRLFFQALTAEAEQRSAWGVHELPVLETEPEQPVVAEPVEEEALEFISSESSSDLNLEEESASNSRGGRMWWIAVLIILLAGGAIWWKPAEIHSFLSERGVEIGLLHRLAGANEVSQDEVPASSTELSNRVFNEEAAGVETGMDSVDSVLQETVLIEEEPVVVEGPTVTFEIIVGSFTTMEQAYEFVEEMKARGIDVKAIDSRMPGNRKKVSYASYPTQAEAYRALKEVQRNIEPGAWVARVERD